MRAALLLLSALTSSISAQIVVSGGGTNLATAVAAAPDGAVLQVQSGTYDGFTMSGKGLTILGTSGVSISGTIDISNTLPFQVVTLRGLTWANGLPSTGDKLLSLDNCAGPVLLEGLVQPPHIGCLASPPGLCFRTTGLSATACSQLYLRGCSLRCTVSLNASDSVIESCVLEGEGYFGYTTGGLTGVQPGRTALGIAGGSTAICGNSTVRGGNGNFGSLQSAQAGNGISISSGTLRVLDGQVTAGSHGAWISYTIAIGTSFPVRISPRVTLSGSSYGPQAGTNVMPQLTGTSATANGALSASVTTETGDLVILVVGLPGPSLTVPGIQDPFWIDPAAYVFLAVGVQQAMAPIAGSIPVPPGNAFLGLRFNWGAVCQGPVTGFQASNPVVTLVY